MNQFLAPPSSEARKFGCWIYCYSIFKEIHTNTFTVYLPLTFLWKYDANPDPGSDISLSFFSMISPSKWADMVETDDSFPGEVTRRWPADLGLPATPLRAGSSLEGFWSSLMFWLLLSAPLGSLLCSPCLTRLSPVLACAFTPWYLGASLPAVAAETFCRVFLSYLFSHHSPFRLHYRLELICIYVLKFK